MNNQLETRRVFTFISSPAWRSELLKMKLGERLIQLPGLPDIEAGYRKRPGSIAIVEPGEMMVESYCQWAVRMSNSPFELTLVAVGQGSLSTWRNALKLSGCDLIVDSLFEAKRVRRLIENHYSKLPKISLSLEKTFELNLPWQPTSE